MNEPHQTAHQMKAGDEGSSNIHKKWAELGPDWSKLGKNGQKWPKRNVKRAILSCTSNESGRPGELKYCKKLAEPGPDWP